MMFLSRISEVPGYYGLIPSQQSAPIRFAGFEIDRAAGELRKDGVRVKIQEQPFQALVTLAERPGEVIPRDELQKRLWPPDVTVDFERGLNKAINRVREALGDDAENPQFIETVPQKGYRFLAPVETAAVVVPPRRRTVLYGSIAAAGVAIAGGLAYRFRTQRIESIAVLPLVNLSGDPAQEYFSDSLTDELIGEVARIGSLRVISRTSVMRYKGAVRQSLPEIARELNVDAVLEGTVVLQGQRVRITAQLIRAADDRHLWTEHYDRNFTDILAVQSEVARTVASQIQIQVTPEEMQSLKRTRQVNPAAYDAFLKGNYFLYRGIRGVERAQELFRQAIALDPLQAEAHAGLAEALCLSGIFGFRPTSETHTEARASALKALEIDESNASAHNAVADVKKGYDWNLEAALVEYRRALKLNPSHMLARAWFAECLSRMERHEEAIAEMKHLLSLDPASPLGHNNTAMLYWRARRYDDAIHWSKLALDLDPNYVNALWWQSLAYAGKHDYPRGIAAATKAVSISGQSLLRGTLGHILALAGDRAKALGVLEDLRLAAGHHYISPVDFAVVHAGLGDAAATFEWLDKAAATRATRVHEIGAPYFDRFRADPRYDALKRRVGLPVS